MISVLQLNIAASNIGIADLDSRIDTLAEVVATHDIDVVALQDVMADDGRDAATLLARRLPEHRHLAHAPTMAVLSRPQFGTTRTVTLSSRGTADDPHRRALLTVAFPDPGFTLAVANTSWLAEQAGDNLREILAALEGTGDVLLVGDLNQPPESPAIRQLTDAGFSDCWALLNPRAAGLTFEVGALQSRIDYALERADATLVVALDLAGDQPQAALSNHAGLIAMIDR